MDTRCQRFLFLLCFLGACLAALACQRAPSPTPEATVEPTVEPATSVNRVVHFPQHLEEIETNRGFPSYGALVLRDGCLRFGQDPESIGGNLLVWPAGFSFDDDGDTVRVMDQAGRVVAHEEDYIRVSTIRNIWEPLPEPVILLVNGRRIAATVSEEEHRELLEPLRPEKHPWFPSECPGPLSTKIVGDEVTAYIPDKEPTVVPVPGSTLFFPRHGSIWHILEHQTLGTHEQLVLEGDCLRLGSGGKVLVWPPGFTPNIENGEVSVRNGGGRTVARVGEMIGVLGNSGPDYRGKCAAGGSYQIHEITTSNERRQIETGE